MTKLTYEQTSKLPKWAQEHIRVLETRLDEARCEKQEWFKANPTAALVVLPYFHDHDHKLMDGSDQPLRDHQTVRFYPGGRNHWSEYLDFRLNKDRKCVEVHGGVGGIFIEPSSGNTCRIGLKEREG